MDRFLIRMDICSNCSTHQWCTRHNQSSYSSLALDIERAIKNQDGNVEVEIRKVSGNKMGSFQIVCNGTMLFSKLSLGYFPHVTGVTNRIFAFIEDVKNGNDLSKYQQTIAPIPSSSPSKTHHRSFKSTHEKKSPINTHQKQNICKQHEKNQQKQNTCEQEKVHTQEHPHQPLEKQQKENQPEQSYNQEANKLELLGKSERKEEVVSSRTQNQVVLIQNKTEEKYETERREEYESHQEQSRSPQKSQNIEESRESGLAKELIHQLNEQNEAHAESQKNKQQEKYDDNEFQNAA